uniref:Uncharacterized protein n=1 Tax=Anguilla anguilla TaxID=7936 RepID=A0A0E9SEN6_ANGAN
MQWKKINLTICDTLLLFFSHFYGKRQKLRVSCLNMYHVSALRKALGRRSFKAKLNFTDISITNLEYLSSLPTT